MKPDRRKKFMRDINKKIWIWCKQILAFIRRILLSVIRNIFSIILKIKPILNFRTIKDIVLFLGIAFCIIYIISIRNTIGSLDVKSIAPDTLVIEKRILDPYLEEKDSIQIDTVKNGGMIIENRFSISGVTKANRIISLSVNGKITQAIIPQGNKFEFSDIVATPGKNTFMVRSINDKGESVVLEQISFIYGKPPIEYLIPDFTRGDLNKKQIALTFDGGWFDNVAHDILDDLKEHDIQCTMFLTGNFLKRFPEVVQRMVDEGHEVGNHMWSHPHLTTYEQNQRHETVTNMNERKVKRELEKTARYFKKLTGKEMPHIWRAPYGEQNEEIRKWAADAGFRHIGWTVGMDTKDWVADTTSDSYYSQQEIADLVLSFGNKSEYEANGAIVLMHLGSLRTGDYPHSMLPFILEELQNRGYEFVKISEMLY